MASDGEEAPDPAPPSLPPLPQIPPYPEMILEAIDALDNENGSNKTAISGYIKRKYGSSLPRSHASILREHLDRMKNTGELHFARNNYFRPDDEKEDPTEPAPDDEKEDPSEPAPADPSSPGGQDPELEDGVSEVPDGVPTPDPILEADADVVPAPFHSADTAPAPAHVADNTAPAPADPSSPGGQDPEIEDGVSEVPDGVPTPDPILEADADVVPAPFHSADTAPAPAHVADDTAPAPATAAAPDAGDVPVKRGRGRPPKPKGPVAVATGGMPRARGRPPKKAKVAEEASTGSPAPAAGNADDANAVPVKRGRGRPPKPKGPVAVATSGMPRSRGRPPKKAKVAEEAPTGSPAPAAGNADDANAVPVKRGRGRPPKLRP